MNNLNRNMTLLSQTGFPALEPVRQSAGKLLGSGASILSKGEPDIIGPDDEFLQDWQTLQNQAAVLLQQVNEILTLPSLTPMAHDLNRMKQNLLSFIPAIGRWIKKLRQNMNQRAIENKSTPNPGVQDERKETLAQMVDLLGPSSRLSNPGGVALEFATPVVQVEDYLRMQYPALLSLKRLGLNLSHYPEPAERPFELTYPASLDRIYGMVVDQARG